MQYTRHHEQTNVVAQASVRRFDPLVVRNRCQRVDCRIGPSVRQNELAPSCFERRQIRIVSVDDRRQHAGISAPSRQVVRAVVPVLAARDEKLEELCTEREVRAGVLALRGCRQLRIDARDPCLPALRLCLAPEGLTGVDHHALTHRGGIDACDGRALRLGDAAGRRLVRRTERQVGNLESTVARVREHTILDAESRASPSRGRGLEQFQIVRGNRRCPEACGSGNATCMCFTNAAAVFVG
jgi:hypothetical protein